MHELLFFSAGILIGIFAYSKGYRAQSPFYKENK
jgi:hypothetical protein|tara:strand:+ start:396 stop:497 length:102 start_codon:yes stop_codon:yes gene_type:complete